MLEREVDSAKKRADDKGMRAARAVAQWDLGDPAWAGRIINAYLNPSEAMEYLRREKGEDAR